MALTTKRATLPSAADSVAGGVVITGAPRRITSALTLVTLPALLLTRTPRTGRHRAPTLRVMVNTALVWPLSGAPFE